MDRRELGRHALIAQEGLRVERLVLVAVDGDGALQVAAPGYGGEVWTSMSELALDLLRAGECILPAGFRVTVEGPGVALRIQGAQVTAVEQRTVQPGELDG